jgi:hypothetical protein
MLHSRRFDASKFFNVICEEDGIKFDSKAEMYRYKELKWGGLKEIRVHPRFLLIPKSAYIKRNLHYEADLMYTDKHGDIWVEEVKGFKTSLYKFKRSMFLYYRTPENPEQSQHWVRLKFLPIEQKKYNISAETFKYRVLEAHRIMP